MRYLIHHETRLVFPDAVREHHCELRLVPREGETLRVSSTRVTIEPEARPRSYVDGFGNRVYYFAILGRHQQLVTNVETIVETRRTGSGDPLDPRRGAAWIADVLRMHPPLWDYVLHRSPYTPDLAPDARELRIPRHPAGTPLGNSLRAALMRAGELLPYDAGLRAIDTPLEAALGRGSGGSHDLAHLLVAMVRTWGIPARYTMGYVGGGPEALQAWVDVLVPGAGWRGFDPVRRQPVDETYVPVAVGRDSRDATPQRGTFTGPGPGTTPDVLLRVTRLEEPVRYPLARSPAAPPRSERACAPS